MHKRRTCAVTSSWQLFFGGEAQEAQNDTKDRPGARFAIAHGSSSSSSSSSNSNSNSSSNSSAIFFSIFAEELPCLSAWRPVCLAACLLACLLAI
jgi:hypothetical protein